MNGYRCIACNKTQSADYQGFTCPACGGNLDITYDYVAAAGELEQGFVDRGTGIFRYSPLLPVDESDMTFPLRVGRTPLRVAGRLGESLHLPRLYFKDDTLNPSASTKDRASAVALQRALDAGARTVAIASTGNAGSSTACLAAALGLRAIVFVPETAPTAKLVQALCYGATVLAVRGNYDDAYDLCLEASDQYGWFNRSTGHNPFTREGKKTCAFEIWEDLSGVPDRIVVPTGDGNILSGMWKGWCDLKAVGLTDRTPKIDCVQSTASAAISNTVARIRSAGDNEPEWSTVEVDRVAASTVADSISVNEPRDGLAAVRAVIESGGAAVTLTDEAIIAAIPEIARTTGVFAEPAAAATWAGVRQMAEDSLIEKDECVVCLISGSGLKDVPGAQRSVGEAIRIDASLEAVRGAVGRF